MLTINDAVEVPDYIFISLAERSSSPTEGAKAARVNSASGNDKL